ncbi:hypothetical protein OAB00_00240 [Akkermansiaceae bacterium]|nr:hypothetical protein [Akkermansiaceae bacterium]
MNENSPSPSSDSQFPPKPQETSVKTSAESQFKVAEQDTKTVNSPDNTHKQKKSINKQHLATVGVIKPYQAILMAIGIGLFILGIYLFLFTHQPDKLLFSVENKKRFFLALVISITGSSFLISGAASKRMLGMSLSVILSGLLCYLPFYFKDSYKAERVAIQQSKYLESLKGKLTPEQLEEVRLAQQKGRVVSKLDLLKSNISYDKIQNLKQAKPELILKAYLIQELDTAYFGEVIRFFQETYGEDLALHHWVTKFPMNEKPAAVLVFQFSKEKEEELGNAISALKSKVFKTDLPDVESLDYNKAIEPQFTNPTVVNNSIIQLQTYYYDAALKSMHREEQLKALRFFQSSDKLVYGYEVLDILNQSLEIRDLKFKEEAVKAVGNWVELIKQNAGSLRDISKHIDVTNQLVVEIANDIIAKNIDVPDAIISYISKNQIKSGRDVLFYQWKKSPRLNKFMMQEAAPLSVKALLINFSKLTDEEAKAASEILGKVGTKEALEQLNELLKATNSEDIKEYLRSSIDGIQKRL